MNPFSEQFNNYVSKVYNKHNRLWHNGPARLKKHLTLNLE
jgi:hypothetical protein